MILRIGSPKQARKGALGVKVTFYGTRGSLPVSHPSQIRYGGNTTCVRVESSCLPEGTWWANDAGTGLRPMFRDFMAQKGKALVLAQTHHHHDHTQGFPLTGFAHIPAIPVTIIGPEQDGVGPREVYEDKIFARPVFPVPFDKVASHIKTEPIVDPMTSIIMIHPKGGVKIVTNEGLTKQQQKGGQLTFMGGTKFPWAQCLIVQLHQSNHPERTISYRYNEWPTGKSFVFLTDHENTAALSNGFVEHIGGADLLVMDCQYTDEIYEQRTGGWGHGTPEYVAEVARKGKVKKLGLTHHDPDSTDDQVDTIVARVKELLADTEIQVFGCQDYMEVEV